MSLTSELSGPLLTCEPVLAEAAFHLRSVSVVSEMVEDGLIKLSFALDENRPQIEALARRYADRQPDLADLCLIRMSELYSRHSVITVDRADFRFYRRNRRETIPLVCPPEHGPCYRPALASRRWLRSVRKATGPRLSDPLRSAAAGRPALAAPAAHAAAGGGTCAIAPGCCAGCRPERCSDAWCHGRRPCA